MRRLPIVLVLFAAAIPAAEAPAWPLWDGRETVDQYAQRVNLPPTKTLDLGNGVKLELVLIPAGQFVMGTPAPKEPRESPQMLRVFFLLGAVLTFTLVMMIVIRAKVKRQRPKFSLRWLLALVFALSSVLYGVVRMDMVYEAWREYTAAKASLNSAEQPAHGVTLTTPFYMGKFPVTQEQYQQVMGTNPSVFNGKDNPVDQISWDDAHDFCKSLSGKSGQIVRLPTEAEWEFSCRAGTITAYYSGDMQTDLDRVGWYRSNSKSTTHGVGQKEANAFGLYDMHGNVRQWCQDWWQPDYYSKSPAEDPQGPAEGSARVLRGGCWDFLPWLCRSAYRLGLLPRGGGSYLGFRVVVPVKSK